MTGSTRLSRRALGRTLTRLGSASVAESLELGAGAPHALDGAARIGFTGAPGAGKSTLISRFAKRRLAACRGNGGVAVLAIDPTSPLSRGAILGDRIRMDAVAGEADLYIRSVSSRSSSDGLADNVADLLGALDRQGFREVLLETVGVGQAEHAIRHLVDTLVIVLQPESGDAVQAMKAGILELADIYVINKADLATARRTAAEIRAITRRRTDTGWSPPVIEIARGREEGMDALDAAVSAHSAWITKHRDPFELCRRRRRYHLQSLITRRIGELLDENTGFLEADDLQQAYRALIKSLAADVQCS